MKNHHASKCRDNICQIAHVSSLISTQDTGSNATSNKLSGRGGFYSNKFSSKARIDTWFGSIVRNQCSIKSKLALEVTNHSWT